MPFLTRVRHALLGVDEQEQAVALPPALAQGYPSKASGRTSFETNPLVYACVRLRAETALSTPIRVYRGAREVTPADAVARLLGEPVLGQTWSDWLECLWLSHDLAGNAYVLRLRGASGRVQAYGVLRPDRVTIERAGDGGIQYAYDTGAGRETFAAADVAHFRARTPFNAFYGMSPLVPAGVAIAADTAMTQLVARFIQNSGAAAGYLSPTDPSQKVKEEDAQSYVNSFNAMLQRGGVAWVSGNVQFTPASKLETPEMKDARDLLETRICSVLEVPPTMVGAKVAALLKAGRNEMAETRRSFWQDTVLPMLRRMEQFLTLMVQADFGPAYAVRFDLSQVDALKDSLEARSVIADRMVGAGVWTRNEGRAYTEQPELVGEDVFLEPRPMGVLAPGQRALAQGLAVSAPVLADVATNAQAAPTPTLALPAPRTGELAQQSNAELGVLFAQIDDDLDGFVPPIRKALNNIARGATGQLGRGVLDANLLLPTSADAALVDAIRPGYRSSAERAWAVVNQWGGLDDLPVDGAALDSITERAEARWRGINQATRNAVDRTVAAGREAGLSDAAIRRNVRGAMRQAYEDRDRVIARNETAYARNEGAAARYKASGVQNVIVEDGDEDDLCAAVAGTTQTLEWYEANPIAHVNCQRYAIPAR